MPIVPQSMSETSAGGIKDDKEPVDCKGRGNWDGKSHLLSFSFDDVYIYNFFFSFYLKSTYYIALIPQREKINGFSPFRW